MSATDELRRMLDERSIHWWAGEGELDRKTHWESGGLTWEYFNDENGDAWLGFLGACESDITPEQAIAATLGAGTCTIGDYKDPDYGYTHDAMWNDEWFMPSGRCSGCGEYIPVWNYCPSCGRKVDG